MKINKEITKQETSLIDVNKDINENELENELDPKLKANIEKWKAKYKHIYKNSLGEKENEFVIWRPLNRKEYKEILDLGEIPILESQELTVKKVLLYPDNAFKLVEERAGIATALAEEVLEHSGFNISQTTEL